MRENMLGYVSKVLGIGVGTGVFILWTKRMPGVDRYDPPGRLCHWPEPIECRRHPFSFDWKTRHAELARVCNLTDTPANAELDYSDETDVIVTVQPLIDWRIMAEAFRRWQRYEYDETSDESDEVSSSDDRDERSAVGSVHGLSMGNDVELLQNAFVMRQMHCGKRCLQSWRRWTKAAQSGRLARDSGGVVTYAGHLEDTLTKKLPQVDFEKSRLRMLNCHSIILFRR